MADSTGHENIYYNSIMNTVKVDNRLYKYESFWRDNKKKKVYDYDNNSFPWLDKESLPDKVWQNRDMFLEKLKDVEQYLRRKNKYIKYDPDNVKSCIISKAHKQVARGMFELNRVRWEDGLFHYIKEHNYRPTDEFIDFIFRHEIDPEVVKIKKKGVTRLKGSMVVKKNKKYLKLDENQIMIIDALLTHGSSKNYIGKVGKDKKKKVFRYSEHAGLLDFDNYGLEKLVVSGNTTRVDPNDNEIFMPQDIPDALDYEYLFHTHPATPKPGGRVDLGILYEFPSISDLFHFMDHYNDGKTQGSIVLAAEGMYIIRKHQFDRKPIEIDENKFFRHIRNTFIDVQEQAIQKYGTNFSNSKFYSDIAQNTEYISKINKVLHKYSLHIDYFPRIQSDKNKWIIGTMYLPIYVVEPK